MCDFQSWFPHSTLNLFRRFRGRIEYLKVTRRLNNFFHESAPMVTIFDEPVYNQRQFKGRTQPRKSRFTGKILQMTESNYFARFRYQWPIVLFTLLIEACEFEQVKKQTHLVKTIGARRSLRGQELHYLQKRFGAPEVVIRPSFQEPTLIC